MKNESEVQQEIMMDAPYFGIGVQRNNVGACKDETGRVIRYGLMNESKKRNKEIKSSDLICITPITITPEMVGKTVGIFTAIEVKKEGWTFNLNDEREQAQSNYHKWVRFRGGIAGFASSVAEFRKLIGR